MITSKTKLLGNLFTKSFQEILKVNSYRVAQPIIQRFQHSETSPSPEVVDVDMDNMCAYTEGSEEIIDVNNNSVINSIDINPWAGVDDDDDEQHTLDIVLQDLYDEDLPCIEPPKKRTGLYEFNGIKIALPQKMLSPGTIRYRTDEDGEKMFPDDIRICRFDI